ncbi:hypothetical protein [Blastococcus deserti]|uniref:Uncharacterized protein n=1 Tax=Blastococcus deserti TaxID=2259033 RepID=A0ABW4XCV9_9ACTN
MRQPPLQQYLELRLRVPPIVAFIDQHKLEHGVEPIWRVRSEAGANIAPSTYCATKARRRRHGR